MHNVSDFDFSLGSSSPVPMGVPDWCMGRTAINERAHSQQHSGATVSHALETGIRHSQTLTDPFALRPTFQRKYRLASLLRAAYTWLDLNPKAQTPWHRGTFSPAKI